VWVVAKPRDDVDVHVGDHVPEAQDVDLVGAYDLAECFLGRLDDAPQRAALARRQIGDLTRVSADDHTAETRVAGLVREDHATERSAPEHAAAVAATQGAVGKHARSVALPGYQPDRVARMKPLLIPTLALVAAATAVGQQREAYVGAPVRYEVDDATDVVRALGEAWARGERLPSRDPEHGFLPGLLAALDVPVSSQTLVFSQTSFQNDRIGPSSPRAIYFGDRAYVGYVPGSGILEVSAVDPAKGAVFYTVEDRGDEAPVVRRDDGACLRCHAFAWTEGWPGHLVRSVFVDGEGRPIQRLGAEVVHHDTSYSERWGGWYVTGEHGAMRHRGNVVWPDDADEPTVPEGGANLGSLEGRFDAERYPSPHSDVVALMVLEHQTRAHNLLAWANYEAAILLDRQRGTNAALGREPEHQSDSTRRRLQDLADRILRCFLFRDEPPLPSPVRGPSSFAVEFPAGGRRDDEGRSLRDLDLQARLFRWPVSYVFESDAFAALHPAVRDIVVLRLERILTGRTGRLAYRHIGDEAREVALGLLRSASVLPSSDG